MFDSGDDERGRVRGLSVEFTSKILGEFSTILNQEEVHPEIDIRARFIIGALNANTMGKNVNFPSTLFHYTSVDAMASIIGNNTSEPMSLRFSSINDLNDKNELNVGLGILKSYFSDIHAKNPWYPLVTRALEDISCSRYKLGCFSLTEEQDSLPLWMSYGEKGEGVSIGFESINLALTEGVFLVKVVYDEDVQKDFLAHYYHPFRNLELIKSELGEDAAYESLKREIIATALMFKSSQWQYEREWRLVCAGLLDETDFKNGKFSRTSYKPLELGSFVSILDTTSTPLLGQAVTCYKSIVNHVVFGPKHSEAQVHEGENWIHRRTREGSATIMATKSRAPLQ